MKAMQLPSIEHRRELCTLHVKLDGKLAKISGASSKFATVWPLDNPTYNVDFSWQAVARIIANGGDFRS